MILYNVTINIADEAHNQWLDWMQNKHIPKVLATNKFIKAKLFKVLVDEEMGGTTYSMQYFAANKTILEQYFAEDAPALRQEGINLFGDKMLAFRTELELIQDFTI